MIAQTAVLLLAACASAKHVAPRHPNLVNADIKGDVDAAGEDIADVDLNALVGRSDLLDLNAKDGADAVQVAEAVEAKADNAVKVLARHERRKLLDLDLGLDLNINLGRVTDIVGGVVHELEDLLDDVEDLVENVVDEVGELLHKVLEAVQELEKSLLSSNGQQRKRSLTRRQQAQVSDATKELFQDVATAIAKVEHTVGEVPILGQPLEEVLQSLNPVLDSVLNLIQDVAGPLADNVVDLAKGVVAGLGDLLDNLVGDTLEAVGGILDGVLDGLLGGLH